MRLFGVTPLASAAFASLAAFAALASCTRDFDAFDPAEDGGASPDSGLMPGKDAGGTDAPAPPKDTGPPPPDTGARDTGANPDTGPNCGQDCFTIAMACDGQCASDELSCAGGCDGGSACLAGCQSTRSQCAMQTCVIPCETCTSNEGCINPSGCMSAAP
jgi:hypothetical protein